MAKDDVVLKNQLANKVKNIITEDIDDINKDNIKEKAVEKGI